MQKRYALLALVPIGVFAACEDSTNQGVNPTLDGGNASVDGSIPPVPEASVPDVDAGPQPVTVIVTKQGAPEPNVPVVFHDADGAVIATETTGPTGAAVHLVPAGSQVTVVMGTTKISRLVTITEVEPGDLLTAIDVEPIDGNDYYVTSVPDGGAGTVRWARAGSCRGNMSETFPLGISVRPDCQVNGTFPLFVTGYEVENDQELGFTFKKSNTFVPTDGGVPIEVQVTEPWSTAFRTHKIALTNVPGNNYGRTYYSEVANGVAMPAGNNFYIEDPGGGSTEQNFTGHTGYPDFVQSEVVARANDSDLSLRVLATREAPPAGNSTTTIDFGQLLPRIKVKPDGLDTTTSERPLVKWTTASEPDPGGPDAGAPDAGAPDAGASDGALLDAADGAFAFISWQVYGADRSGSWSFVTPPNRRSVKAPALPPALSAYAPPASDAGVELSFNQPATVSVIEGSFINGYRDMRKFSAAIPASTAFDWTYDSFNRNFTPPLPVAGTLRATAYTRSDD